MAPSKYSSSARSMISRHVRKHREDGMPQDQAVAAAMSEARRKGKKVPARTRRSTKAGKARGTKKASGATRGSASRGATRRGSKSAKARAGAKGGRATARKQN